MALDEKVQFCFCLFFTTLIDQAIHAGQREEHSVFDLHAQYPKIVGILSGAHANVHPALLLGIATLYLDDRCADDDLEELAQFFRQDYRHFLKDVLPTLPRRQSGAYNPNHAVEQVFFDYSVSSRQRAGALGLSLSSSRQATRPVPEMGGHDSDLALLSKSRNTVLPPPKFSGVFSCAAKSLYDPHPAIEAFQASNPLKVLLPLALKTGIVVRRFASDAGVVQKWLSSTSSCIKWWELVRNVVRNSRAGHFIPVLSLRLAQRRGHHHKVKRRVGGPHFNVNGFGTRKRFSCFCWRTGRQ